MYPGSLLYNLVPIFITLLLDKSVLYDWMWIFVYYEYEYLNLDLQTGGFFLYNMKLPLYIVKPK